MEGYPMRTVAFCFGLLITTLACAALPGSVRQEIPPLPSVTPSPTEAATFTPRSTSGLGVSRDQVMSVFDDLALEWGPVESIEGRPEVGGATLDDLGLFTALYLVGPEEDLEAVRLLVGLAFQEPVAESDRVLSYQKRLLATVLPTWSDGPRWLEATFGSSQVGGAYTTTFDGKEIRLGIVPREDGAVMVGLEILGPGYEE